MARKRQVALWVGGGFVAAVAIVAIALVVFTRTQFGVEKTGRYLLNTVAGSVNGSMDVDRITSRGGLLGGLTLHGVDVRTADGRPLVQADSVSLSYNWRTFLAGRIVFDALDLYRPRVVLERLPGDTAWNFQKLLASSGPDTATASARQLILIGGAHIVNGTVTVRTPIQPDSGGLQPADTARYIVESAPGGLVRVMRFEDFDARVPRILVSTPEEPGRLIEIASLSTRGYVWQTPFDLRDLRGTLMVQDSVVALDFDRLLLPDSRASIVGRVVMGDSTRMNLEVDASSIAFSDLQWLSPDLPEKGTGRVQLRLQTQPNGGTLYYARNLDLSAPGTHIVGDVGIVTGPTTYFTDVNLRADPLDVGLLDKLIPGNLPTQGLHVGRLQVQGPAD